MAASQRIDIKCGECGLLLFVYPNDDPFRNYVSEPRTAYAADDGTLQLLCPDCGSPTPHPFRNSMLTVLPGSMVEFLPSAQEDVWLLGNAAEVDRSYRDAPNGVQHEKLRENAVAFVSNLDRVVAV